MDWRKTSARRIGRVLFVAFLIGTIFGLLLAQSPESLRSAPSEDQVKAVYLLNFIRFVDWPDSVQRATAPFTICVTGNDPLGTALEQILAGEVFRGRPITVQRVRRGSGSCQVLYSGAGTPDLGLILRGAGPGVLTVGEGDDYLDAGGMIAFITENRRIRFDVNQQLASEMGLGISSRLLSVARKVRSQQ